MNNYLQMNDSSNFRFLQNSYEIEDKGNQDDGKRLLYVAGNKISKTIPKQKEPFSAKHNLYLDLPFNNSNSIKSHSARVNSFRKDTPVHQNKSVRGTIWRPPLQRSRPINYLPYIQNCVKKTTQLLYLDQDNEEEESYSTYDIRINNKQQRPSVASACHVESTKHIPFIKPSNTFYNVGKRRISTACNKEKFSTSFIDTASNQDFENTKTSNVNPILHDNYTNYSCSTNYHNKNKASRNITADMNFQTKAKSQPKDSLPLYQKPDSRSSSVNSSLYNNNNNNNNNLARLSSDVSSTNTDILPKKFDQQLELNQKAAALNRNVIDPDEEINLLISGSTANIKKSSHLKKLDLLLSGTAINTLKIYNITINEMIPYIGQICNSFQNIVNLECFNTKIETFQQLEILVQIRHLQNLFIETSENEITNHPYWQLYIVYRMAHLSLKTINGEPLTKEKHQAAQQIFGSLVQMLRNAPHRRRINNTTDESTIQQTLLQTKGEKCDDTSKTIPSMVLISAYPVQINSRFAELARQNTITIMERNLSSLWKQWLFQKTWTAVHKEIISKTLNNLSNIDSHMKNCFKDIQSTNVNVSEY